MVIDNPFIVITSTGEEEVVDRVEESIDLQLYINEVINNGGIILINGDPGVGKSTIINFVLRDIKKRDDIKVIKDSFTPSVLSKIKSLSKETGKKLLVILDDFNNIELIDKDQRDGIIRLLNELGSIGIGIIVVNNTKNNKTQKLINKIKTKFYIINVRGMKDEDIKKIIINRLNLIRKTKSNSLSPFTEEEIDKIIKEARGNPRIVLLICATLYDTKKEKLI